MHAIEWKIDRLTGMVAFVLSNQSSGWSEVFWLAIGAYYVLGLSTLIARARRAEGPRRGQS